VKTETRTVAEIFLWLSCARMRHAISSSVAIGSAPSAVFRLDGVGFMVAAFTSRASSTTSVVRARTIQGADVMAPPP
jgi:hypothetical protein